METLDDADDVGVGAIGDADQEPTGDDGGEGDVPTLEDEYGEAVLATHLGVNPVTPVVPCSDSQVPPDSMCPGAVNEEEQQEVPERLEYPPFVDSPIAPTELETTPPHQGEAVSEVVDITDSPPITIPTEVKDPVPSANMYSMEVLEDVRARIAKLKYLEKLFCFAFL